ncbi:ADP-ribosylglycohydrolase-domain-containing protein, partial [Endogone sp. FLAS-F59071]
FPVACCYLVTRGLAADTADCAIINHGSSLSPLSLYPMLSTLSTMFANTTGHAASSEFSPKLSDSKIRLPEDLSTVTTLTREQLADKIKGLIFGAAIGDGLGLATEFMSKKQAFRHYGTGPIKFGNGEGVEFFKDSHRSRWQDSDFTDDTDQQLLILSSLLSHGGELDHRDFALRLKRWTQQGNLDIDKPPYGIGFTVGSVLNHPSYEKEPHKAAWDVWCANDCNLAANGAVMRTAILGVPKFWDEEAVVQNAIDAGAVTHADPRCLVSCVIVCVLVSRMLRGAIPTTDDSSIITDPSPTQSFSPVSPLTADALGSDPSLTALVRSIVATYAPLLSKPLPYRKRHNPTVPIPSFPSSTLEEYCFPSNLAALKLEESNSIGYTYKCLGSAVYLFTRQFPEDVDGRREAFRTVMTELTLEAGDADTNAAVAGALLGARLGLEGLPREWVEGLRHREYIEGLVDGLIGML